MSFRVVFAVLLLISSAFAVPSWFDSLPSKGYEIIGYGSGKDYEEAIAQAKANIASVIRTEVRTSQQISSSASKKSYSHEARSDIETKSSAVLAGAEVIRREQIKKEYFVAVKYDTRSFEVKFLEKIGANKKCLAKPSFLNKSAFGETLRNLAGCDLELSISKNANSFFVSSGNATMAWESDTIEQFFVEQADLDIRFDASKRNLKDGEEFYLTIKSNKMGGFITLFNLYDEGQVALMVDNLPNANGKLIKIPQIIDENLILEASAGGKNETRDLYIAIWHSDKLSFATFDTTTDQVLKKENFAELARLLDQHSFSSTVVRVRK